MGDFETHSRGWRLSLCFAFAVHLVGRCVRFSFRHPSWVGEGCVRYSETRSFPPQGKYCLQALGKRVNVDEVGYYGKNFHMYCKRLNRAHVVPRRWFH